jgi:hypothetical protein
MSAGLSVARRCALTAVLSLSLAAAILLAHPAQSAWASPPVTVGFGSYWTLSGQDLSDIADGWPNHDGHGLQSMRETIQWTYIEPNAPTRPCPTCPLVHQYKWDGYDKKMVDLARSGIVWVPQLDGTPDWVSGEVHNATNPPHTDTEIEAFRDYVDASVRRYGPNGSFWAAHPELPYRPLRSWELWNEPNLDVFFGGRTDPALYARLLRAAGSAIHQFDPAGELMIGGLAGAQKDWPGAMNYTRFLPAVFAADPGVRDVVDSVAYHPYADSPEKTVANTIAFRQFVDANLPRGSQLGLWVNEFGWATQGACDFLCAGPKSYGWMDQSTEASYEAVQAQWLTAAISGMMVRRQALNLRGLMMWILADQPTDENHRGTFNDDGAFNFTGLLKTPRPWKPTPDWWRWPSVRDLTPKPAWDAVRQLVASGNYSDPWPGLGLASQSQPSPPPSLTARDLVAQLGWRATRGRRRGTVTLTAARAPSGNSVQVCGSLKLKPRRGRVRRLAVGACRRRVLGRRVQAIRTLGCKRGSRGTLTGRLSVRDAGGRLVWSRSLKRKVAC